MPYALCPMPYARGPDSTSYESSKGYISLKRTPLSPRRLQPGKNPIAKMLEIPICLKVNPVRPPQFWVNLGFKRLIAAFGLFLALVLGVV